MGPAVVRDLQLVSSQTLPPLQLFTRSPCLPSCSGSSGPAPSRNAHQYRPCHSRLRRSAVERDLDWEPVVTKGPLRGPTKGGYTPPPPPELPPGRRAFSVPEGPFKSRRDIALTMLGGGVGLWLLQHKVIAPVDSFGQKPDVPFNLVGYTDLPPEAFQYFKTPGGAWVAGAEDEQGRFFMIDEIGDLFYDSGDPQVGLYAMDTEGDLYNIYRDTDGQQKVTPVGNIADLKSFKISEVAGLKLDREVDLTAFEDGRAAPLPPGSTSTDPETGQEVGPDQLIEGYQIPSSVQLKRASGQRGRGGLLEMFSNRSAPDIDKFELDLASSKSARRQLFEQTLLDDPTIPGFQPALPEGFDIEALEREVEEEMRRSRRK